MRGVHKMPSFDVAAALEPTIAKQNLVPAAARFVFTPCKPDGKALVAHVTPSADVAEFPPWLTMQKTLPFQQISDHCGSGFV